MTTNSLQLYDLSFLEQMDDKNFLIQVIELYINDTQSDINDMKQALGTGGLDTVYRVAHKLKSSTGMLQAHTLYSTLELTEKMAKEQGPKTEVEALISSVESQFDSLKTALQVELKMLTNAA